MATREGGDAAPADGAGADTAPVAGLSRRAALTRLGGAAAAVWAAPTVVSVPAAHAQGSTGALRLILGHVPAGGSYSDDGGETSVAATGQPAAGVEFTYCTALASDGAARVVMVGWEQGPQVSDPDRPWAWTSVDHGETWATITLPRATGQATAVATDGAGNWVLAGIDGIGFLRSTDGTAWAGPSSPPTPLPEPTATYITVATDGAGTWVGAGLDGACRSSDAGDTWTAATTPPAGVVTDLATDGAGTWAAAGMVFGAPNELAFWRSTDDGDTWARVPSPTPAVVARSLVHDQAARWLACSGSTVYVSTDSGATWAETAAQPPNVDTLSAVTTDGAGRWVACGRTAALEPGVWWSTDAGASWNEVVAPPPLAQRPSALTFDRLVP